MLLVDAFSSSEALGMGTSVSSGTSSARTARFSLGPEVRVIGEDGRDVEAGSGRSGVLALGGRIPLGYYKDEAKSAATFRTIDGIRYSVPGDYAEVGADGSIHLLGRGSVVINTGGEKVYPEEVELALRAHADVFDCVVVGVPDDRWGEMVVALVHARDGQTIDADALTAHCRVSLAAYKVPKRVVVVDSLERSPAGKADYKQLREVAVSRVRTEVHP
jgi:3-oxocholest-4-en-26-oate---CoA ligase